MDMGELEMPRSAEKHPVPENLPRHCGRCGSLLWLPMPIQMTGFKVKEGSMPPNLEIDEKHLPELWFRWMLICTKKKCRTYQMFNVGGRLQDDGILDPEEYDDYRHFSSKS